MATRLYYDYNIGPPFAVAVDGAWDVTASTLRIRLTASKGDPGSALATFANGASTGNSPAGASDVLIGQAISEPIAANVTISAAIKGYMRVLESNAAADMRSQMVVRIVQPNGTVRGTLIAASASALASEWTTVLTNRKMPLGSPVTPTSVNAVAGDRIVVEFGYRKHENAATSRSGSVSLGSPTGTDILEDETSTTANVPWIEFADTITFLTGAMTSQAPVEVVVLPTSQKARTSQEPVEVVVLPTSQKARLSQGPVEVVVAQTLTPTIAHGDLVIDAAIGNVARSDLAFDATIRSAAHGDLAFDYVTRAAGHGDLVFNSITYGSRIADLVIDYVISEVDVTQVGSDLEIDYSVGSPTAVAKDLAFSYRVTKASHVFQRGVDLKLKMKVTGATIAGRNLQINAAVETTPPVVVAGADLDFDDEVSVNTLAGADLDFTAEVEIPRPRGDLTFDAAVTLAAPSSELGLDYPIANAVNSSLGITAAIQGATASTLGFDYEIRSFVDSDLEFEYELRTLDSGSVSADGDSHDGPGRRYVIVESRQKPQVFVAGANLVIDHRIEESVSADMTLTSAIRVLASVDMDQTYAVHKLVAQKYGLDHKIVDFYDTNRGILLSEIDDDLALTA